MTSLLDGPADLDVLEAPDLDHLADDPGQHVPEDEERTVSAVTLALAVVSAALSSAGAAWMVGGVFRGYEARLVGFLGVLLGCGLVYAGTRLRSSVLQYLVLPGSLLLGAVLMSSSSGAGTSSLPALVKDAATSSQLLQPPVDFAPGWKLILVVLLARRPARNLFGPQASYGLWLAVPLAAAAALIPPRQAAAQALLCGPGTLTAA